MKEINVEEIMAEIRQEIKDKGYTADMLSFKDVTTPVDDAGHFSLEEFRNTVGVISASRYVPGRTNENIGNGVKGLIKKVIRKLVWFNIAPISDGQNMYNEQVATALLQILNYIEEQNRQMEEYKEKLDLLQDRLDSTK